MADARRPSLIPSATMSADQVARRNFVMARRGYDPGEVRSFLEWVAAGVDAAALREEDLRRRLEEAERRLADAEKRAANPELDEPTLTAALGQETAKVLRSAHEAANELTARAEENAARLLRQADEDSARLHDRASSVLSERTEEAEAAAAELRRAARSEASAVVGEARRESDALIERTREECREMVRETQELRARILGDLARRRRILYTQVEQLRAGKGSLTEALSGVRRSVDQIHEGLRRAEEEARVAADSAARRVAAEPEPTGEELARASHGAPLRSSTLDVPGAREIAPAKPGAPTPEGATAIGAGGDGDAREEAPASPASPVTSPERPDPEPVAAASASAPPGPPAPPPVGMGGDPATAGAPAPAYPSPDDGGAASDGGVVAAPHGESPVSNDPAPESHGGAEPVADASPAREKEARAAEDAPGAVAPGQSLGGAAGGGRPLPPPLRQGPRPGQRVGAPPGSPTGGSPPGRSRSDIPGRANHPAVIGAERAAGRAAGQTSGPGGSRPGRPGEAGTKSAAGPADEGEEAAAPSQAGSGAESKVMEGPAGRGGETRGEGAPAGEGEGSGARRGDERRLSSLRLIRRSRSGASRSPQPAPSSDGEPDEGVESVRILDRPDARQAGVPSDVASGGGTAQEASPAASSTETGEAVGGQAGEGGGRGTQADSPPAEEGAAVPAATSTVKVPDEVGEEAVNALFARIRASRAAALAGGAEESGAGEDAQPKNGASGGGDEPGELSGRSGGRSRAGAGRSGRPGGRSRRSKGTSDVPGSSREGAPEAGAVATAERRSAGGPEATPRREQEAAASHQEESVPPLSAEEEILQRRDAMIEPIVAALARKLKRALQDEQNDALDRLRSRKAKAVAEVLVGEAEQLERYRQVSQAFLVEAAVAGATFAGAGAGAKSPPGAAETEAVELSKALVGPLRRRIDAGLGELVSGDEVALFDHIGAAYREWKGQRIERLAGDHVTGAFARGAMAVTPEGAALAWIVDDEGAHCPDCDDNALAGPMRRGDTFPTGQAHPPAHPGCRCLLVTAST